MEGSTLRIPRLLALLLTLSMIIVPLGSVAQTIEELVRQGNSALSARDYSRAESIFREVIRRSPSDAPAYTNLGLSLIHI